MFWKMFFDKMASNSQQDTGVSDPTLLTDAFLEDERNLTEFVVAKLKPTGWAEEGEIKKELQASRDLRAKLFKQKDEMCASFCLAEYVLMVEHAVSREEIRDKDRAYYKLWGINPSRINAELLRYQTNKFKTIMRINQDVDEVAKKTQESPDKNKKRKAS